MDRFNVPETSQAMVNRLLVEKMEECEQLKSDLNFIEATCANVQKELQFLKSQFYVSKRLSGEEKYITTHMVYEHTDEEDFKKLVDCLGLDMKEKEES